MADKNLVRPQNVTSWANDALINDPGESWDATPTKVDPGDGKRDDGHLPNEIPPAQHENHVKNEIGLWLQYFADMQALNWFYVGETVEPSTAAVSGEALTYDEGVPGWLIAGRAGVANISRDGQAFRAIANHGAGTATWAASKCPDQAPTHTGANTIVGNNAGTTVSEYTGAWANQVLPGTAVVGSDVGLWDSVNQLWLVGGGDNSLPSFWRDATPISGFTQTVPARITSTTVVDMATNPNTGLTVAVGDNGSFDVWTTTDGVTWNRSTPTGIGNIPVTEQAQSIEYDPVRDLFVLLTDEACYTSTDGVNYTQQSGGGTLQRSFGRWAPRCLEIVGSLYLAAEQTDSIINYSVDGGATWRYVQQDNPATTASGSIAHIIYNRSRGAFLAVWEDQPNQAHGFLSLAIGTALYNAIDRTIALPTVT